MLGDELVGRETRFERSWSSTDSLLYCLGIGAGHDPAAELCLTTENSEDVEQRVPAAYVAVLAQTAITRRLGIADLPKGSLIHAEQAVELERPLPVAGRVSVLARVEKWLDCGPDVLLRVSTTCTDLADGSVLARTALGYRIRGQGTGGAAARPRPEAASEPAGSVASRVLTTRPEQALLYRLSGDRNPLHSDPAVAARTSFGSPILHGLCTFGVACRGLAILLADGDPSAVRSMRARFSRPVRPGESLTIEVWRVADGHHEFQVTSSAGDVVLKAGRVGIAADATTARAQVASAQS